MASLIDRDSKYQESTVNYAEQDWKKVVKTINNNIK